MKVVVALLALLLAGCSSGGSGAADGGPSDEPAPSWIAMVPGDAAVFDGPGGEMLLIYVDETYAIDRTNASALTWEHGDRYTTDYVVQDDDGALWWYGRRGSWRAGRHGEEPRAVDLADHEARFGDRVITLSEDGDPVQLETPDGVYTSRSSS